MRMAGGKKKKRFASSAPNKSLDAQGEKGPEYCMVPGTLQDTCAKWSDCGEVSQPWLSARAAREMRTRYENRV